MIEALHIATGVVPKKGAGIM